MVAPNDVMADPATLRQAMKLWSDEERFHGGMLELAELVMDWETERENFKKLLLSQRLFGRVSQAVMSIETALKEASEEEALAPEIQKLWKGLEVGRDSLKGAFYSSDAPWGGADQGVESVAKAANAFWLEIQKIVGKEGILPANIHHQLEKITKTYS
jgi:hypothetical protein